MTAPPRPRRLALVQAALAAVLVVVALPAAAGTGVAGPLAELQRLDARVQTVGWRLARGNARFCPDTRPGVGLQLHDIYNYGDPPAVRHALALSSDIAVQAVAADGPAARAGLAANAALAAVADQAVGALPPARPGNHARLAALHDRLDQTLAASGKLVVEVLDGERARRVTIAGEQACATRFEMITEGDRAAADGQRVVVSRRLVEFLPEDELLAAVLAHELAHNVLRHRARLDAAGRTWANVLATEREADRLSVWLLANAGYDPAAAVRFMTRWGPANDHGIFSSPDHDRWKTRRRRISAELARLAGARAADPAGAADWRRDFALREPS